MSAKPTAGEWQVDESRNGFNIRPKGTGYLIAFIDHEWMSSKYQPAAANAALIAEAGTVLHETGLTPRQLAEQRAALQALLAKPAHAHIDGAHLDGKVEGCMLCNAMTERDSLKEQRAELVAALEAVEEHHVEQNFMKQRDEARSKTLRIVRAALAKVRGGAA
jgi:hypothetical protein